MSMKTLYEGVFVAGRLSTDQKVGGSNPFKRANFSSLRSKSTTELIIHSSVREWLYSYATSPVLISIKITDGSASGYDSAHILLFMDMKLLPERSNGNI